MGWEDSPVVQEAPKREAWESAPVVYPAQKKIASGISEAIQAGWQGSVPGLVDRGRMPDIVLDQHNSKWYERAAAGASQLVNELPEMWAGGIAGAAAGGAVGTVVPGVGNAIGALVGGGAGAFALPAAIRESYVQAYTKGDVTGSADFLNRASIVLKHTGKEALVGAATAGMGKVAGVAAEAAGLGAKATAAATLGAEGSTLVVAPALLEGRLPEPQDFTDAAILLVGLKGASVGVSRLANIYAKTGKTPLEVMADAKADPTIAADLVNGAEPVAPAQPTPRELVEQATSKYRNGAALGQWLKDAHYGNGLAEAADALGIVTPPGTYKGAVLDQIKAAIGGETSAGAKAPKESAYNDTRGMGERFHGTSAEIPALSDAYAMAGDNRNIYGQGFYTTDAVDISAGYMRKGGNSNPTLYKVEADPNLKVYDMEAALTPEVTDMVKRVLGDEFPTTNAETGATLKNLREIFDEYRKDSQYNGLSRDDVQMAFDAIRTNFEAMGYKGYEHIGGIHTGKSAHNVKIYWTPEKDLKITKTDLDSYRRKVAEIDVRAEHASASAERVAAQTELFRETPSIPRAYRSLAREEMLNNVLGPERDVQLKEVMANPSGTITTAKEPNHINYRYIESPEDVQTLHAKISEVFKDQIEAQRGTETWAETMAKAEADIRSRDPADIVGVDLTDLASKTLAAQAMAQRAAFDVKKAAADIRAAGAEATPEMFARQIEAIETAALLHAVDQRNGANLARALNARKAAREANQLGKVSGDLLAQYGNDPRKLAEHIGEIDTAEGMAKFAVQASKATTWEKVIEAWKAGLVSGPITQVANILGNTTFAATRPLVDAVAAAVGGIRRNPEAVHAVEPLARITGNINGVIDGAKVAMSVLKTGDLGGKAESHRKAIEGTVGEVVRTPFRLLSAADAFFRTVNERGEAYAIATREAAKEGFNPSTREFRERVAQIVENPTDKMQEQIDAAGVRFTFNSPLGEKGRAIQQTIKKLHLEWAVPFIQTPANVAVEMMRLTPGAPAIKGWRDAIAKGGAEADKAVAEMVIGTAVGTAVFSFAVAGNISGQGDPDPRKRATQAAIGWQPYSIKIGDKWYSYQRLQPVGTLVGMAADAASAWEHMTPEESDKVPKILFTAFANAITNQTFLQGVTQLVNAVSDPERFGPKFVQNVAASAIPAIVGQTAQMLDPYQREVYSVLDAVQNRIPVAREGLQPKRDPYGEPVAAKDRMGEISPINVSKETDDKVRSEAARLGVGVAKAPDHIELPAGRDKKLGKIELTPEQRDVFADKSGHMAHQILTQIVNQPSWDDMPDMAQRMAMEKVFEASRKMGKAAAFPPEQIVKKAQEISAELQRRMQTGQLSE